MTGSGQSPLTPHSAPDVIHNLWVPELNRKIDVIPGRTNRVCEELQRGEVVAVRRKVVEAEPVA